MFLSTAQFMEKGNNNELSLTHRHAHYDELKNSVVPKPPFNEKVKPVNEGSENAQTRHWTATLFGQKNPPGKDALQWYHTGVLEATDSHIVPVRFGEERRVVLRGRVHVQAGHTIYVCATAPINLTFEIKKTQTAYDPEHFDEMNAKGKWGVGGAEPAGENEFFWYRKRMAIKDEHRNLQIRLVASAAHEFVMWAYIEN